MEDFEWEIVYWKLVLAINLLMVVAITDYFVFLNYLMVVTIYYYFMEVVYLKEELFE